VSLLRDPGSGGVSRPVQIGAVLGVITALWTISLGHVARADVPACDPGPTVDYTGSDDAAAQVHELRLEVGRDCDALAARLDGIEADTSRLTTASGPNVTCANCVESGANVPASVEFGPQARAQLDDNTRALLVYAVFGFGLAAGLLFAYLLYRQVMPRP